MLVVEKDIKKLSTHLFWDTPIENVDPAEHCGFIVERVMRYGRIEDWRMILRWYGVDGLKDVVVGLRDLDNVGISFLCLMLDLENEDFRCYRERQSQLSFWES